MFEVQNHVLVHTPSGTPLGLVHPAQRTSVIHNLEAIGIDWQYPDIRSCRLAHHDTWNFVTQIMASAIWYYLNNTP